MTTTDTNLEEGRTIFWGSYREECQDLDLVLSFLAIIKCESLFHQILKVRMVCTNHSFYPDRLTVLLHTPIIVQFPPNKNMGTWL